MFILLALHWLTFFAVFLDHHLTYFFQNHSKNLTRKMFLSTYTLYSSQPSILLFKLYFIKYSSLVSSVQLWTLWTSTTVSLQLEWTNLNVKTTKKQSKHSILTCCPTQTTLVTPTKGLIYKVKQNLIYPLHINAASTGH